MTHHAKAHPDGSDTASVSLRCRFSAPATPLAHHWEACVGSGHAALCLRADWQGQIEQAHRDLGFERVRFHGILSDDVGTLVDVAGELVYSFHNADLIMDHVLSIGMRPFVELSFMPTALASGDERVFSYQDNVTPPKAIAAFSELCARLVGHWLERYGKPELDQWRFEVWNEPNLEAFWTGGQQGYFDLYRATAAAIKEVSPSLQVGGPATARSEWVSEFIAFCAQNAVPLDCVTTHIYPTDALGGQGTDTMKQLAESGRDFLQKNARGTHDKAAGLPVYYIEGAPAPKRAWVERIDEDHANPRRRWAEWGALEYLDRHQVDELRACSALTPEAIPWDYTGETIELTLNVPPNAVAALTLELTPRQTVKVVEPAAAETGSDDEMLHGLQRESFSYFLFQTDEETGLVADRNAVGAPASIAAIGLALASYNPTFGGDGARGWVAEAHLGINQGPIVMMIENHRSELPWSLMRRCPYVVDGLRRAGFTGGWLEPTR